MARSAETPTDEVDAVETQAEPTLESNRTLVHRLLAHVPFLLRVYQLSIVMIGGGIVALGLLLIPLPGPGWVIVFAGVWVLGLEFPGAKRVLAVMKRWLAAAVAWLRRQREKRQLQKAIAQAEADAAAATDASDADRS